MTDISGDQTLAHGPVPVYGAPAGGGDAITGTSPGRCSARLWVWWR